MTKPTYVNSEAQQFKNHQKRSALAPFSFYQAMNYPIPQPSTPFSLTWDPEVPPPKNQKNWILTSDFSSFSRSEISPLMQEFLNFIQNYHWLYPQFPFVKAIYLCNSLTFNALRSTSDIDIFVITQEGRLRTARFFMAILMWIFQIKRTASITRKRFCLSFFVDEAHQNLEPLLLHDHDYYLPYRIAHLVPLYQEKTPDTDFDLSKTSSKKKNPDICSSNPWIIRFLPNRSPTQHIHLPLQSISSNWTFKQSLQWIFKGRVGDFLEHLLQKVRSFWIKRKKAKNPDRHHGVITSPSILKFHHDQRQKYSDLLFPPH